MQQGCWQTENRCWIPSPTEIVVEWHLLSYVTMKKNVDLHLQQFKVHSNPFNMYWTHLTIFTNPNMFLKPLQNSNPRWHLLLKWPLLLPVQATSSDCPATLTSWWNADNHMRHVGYRYILWSNMGSIKDQICILNPPNAKWLSDPTISWL